MAQATWRPGKSAGAFKFLDFVLIPLDECAQYIYRLAAVTLTLNRNEMVSVLLFLGSKLSEFFQIGELRVRTLFVHFSIFFSIRNMIVEIARPSHRCHISVAAWRYVLSLVEFGGAGKYPRPSSMTPFTKVPLDCVPKATGVATGIG
jgi:hypothetical protein